MTEAELSPHVDRLRGLIEAHLRVNGRSLEAQLRKAGRRIPRTLRRDGAAVVEAQALVAHPKLSQRVEPARIEAAVGRLADWLVTVDPKEVWKDRLLGIAGSIAFAFIVLFAALVWVLVQRGYV